MDDNKMDFVFALERVLYSLSNIAHTAMYAGIAYLAFELARKL